MELTRITLKYAYVTVTATNHAGQPVQLTDIAVAALPPDESPSASTSWTAVEQSTDGARVLLAGPDADSSNAIVIPDDRMLWGRSIDTPEVDAVALERITLQ